MKSLWNYIENKNWEAERKYSVVLTAIGTVSALTGFIIWLLIRTWVLADPVWAVCFAGYPALISGYASILYLFRHEFQSGTPAQE